MFKGNIIAEKVKNLLPHMAAYAKGRDSGGDVTYGYGIGKGAMIHYTVYWRRRLRPRQGALRREKRLGF
jgi:hypothetical protein